MLPSLYNKLSSSLLNTVYSKLDQLETDLDYNNNIITCNVDNIGEYVINRQPSTYEVWLSSPISGPSKYKLTENKNNSIYQWLNKNKEDILTVLDKEIEHLKKSPLFLK